MVFLSFFFIFGQPTQAKESEFITIVIPVRISYYTPNPKESIQTQYSIIRQNNLPATWLLTYDAMINEGIFSVTKIMNKKQELGVFLEVTPRFAEAATIVYHNTGSWHHATSVFLSGYTQEERIKLIDTVFEKFKESFGYYPTSVGSWWTDSFSLSYMKDKYKITANLGVADQFSTDGYQVWGQYFSVPFYPSKYHAGVPATSIEVKLDLVSLQWAPRDPLNGYKSSLYSTQDYHTIGLRLDYFEKLIELYARKNKNAFGQITVGLEGDFSADAYKNDFKSQMELVGRLRDSKGFSVTSMRDFGRWYRDSFPDLSPTHIIETDDLLGKRLKVTWFQSPFYRIGFAYDYDSQKTKIFDFRTYHPDLKEPYYLSPNREFELSIYIPSYLDEIQNAEDIWEIALGEDEIELFADRITLPKGRHEIDIPRVFERNPAVDIKQSANKTEIIPNEKWLADLDGEIIKDYSAEAIHFFKQKKAILYLLLGQGWQHFQKVSYQIPQGEIDALFRLSLLPKGKVLVYDSECLQCSWHTAYKPPAFSNRREYIQNLGEHPIVYNSSVFNAANREEARSEFSNLDVEYIYLVKFEEYIEKTPFSPGDLGIEKIYDNANAEIWRVKDD